MIIGYARTSTTDQKAGLEAQLRELVKVPCDEVFQEEVSSVDQTSRGQLECALQFIRKGDVLVVTKLDRLARSVKHLLEITERVEAKGATLRILDAAIDTATPNGRLMLNLLGSIAQFEREIMLERQREGIAKAKAEGKYRGRKPTGDDVVAELKRLVADGVPIAEAGKRVGISRATAFRVVKET
ncbi:MAG: recombinase family protein [Pseudotabrizicola sp.]|uniref:recombinase family protein n=1 Tax=Pseudotabrizicola sp. TaxID=2939647 RepID=UPI00272017AD|nr:recombinase family protein [Pseudotabrizicola sp.]MDO9639810.1 recombinase family protein [Pseudotabrizicola sp.]